MEVIKSKDFRHINIGPLVIAIGTFDGLHQGHQAVINKAKKIAEDKNLAVAVYTFNPHPLKIVKPAIAPKSIISSRQKIELLANFDIDYYLEQKFTSDFSSIDYQDFILNFLLDKFNMKHLVVGEDFHLGKMGKGTIENIEKLTNNLGFDLTAVKTVEDLSIRVSSTLIRELISEGNIKKASLLLDRPYRLYGKVIRGFGRGKKLGYPTANIKLDTDYSLPPRGVYACYVDYDSDRYKGVVNFGYNPTFGGVDYSIEVHIIDFNKTDIYDKNISIDLIEQIRSEMTFDSSVDLIEQIKKDILYTKNLLCYN
ncbi:bifunctional riboflavin kinase/FAD synthetase [Natronospora cellulosivora (SeqCode)]